VGVGVPDIPQVGPAWDLTAKHHGLVVEGDADQGLSQGRSLAEVAHNQRVGQEEVPGWVDTHEVGVGYREQEDGLQVWVLIENVAEVGVAEEVGVTVAEGRCRGEG